VRKSTIAVFVVMSLLVASGAVLLAQLSVSVKPALFKMRTIGGNTAVPLNGPVIRVPYDRTQRRYLSIDEEPLELQMVMTTSCGSANFRDMSLAVAGVDIPVSGIGLGKGNNGFSGTKTISTNAVTTRALDNASVPNPVAICNADLEALVAKEDYGTAQGGWARRYDNALPATLTLRCAGEATKKGGFKEPPALYKEAATTRFPVWVHCGPAAVFRSSPKSQPRARRTEDVEPKTEPQRVPAPPQRVGSQPQRVAGAPPQKPLPDLLIITAQPAPSSPRALRVHVANKGSAASTPAKMTLFYHRSGKIMKVVADVPALGPGATRWVVVDAGSPLEFATHLTLRVDDPPNVAEVDETNNAFTVK
jgi:hypothetical protein